MRDNPFEGNIVKSYKPICFKYYDRDIRLEIIPGWEYVLEFSASDENGRLFAYNISNLDNGYVTKKTQRERFNELLKHIEKMYKEKPKYEQLSMEDFL